MTIDPLLTLASFGVGIVVGLTGMGGGALMTPVLVLFFGIPPLAAVSSDLVASACGGSIPAAFCGVLLARSLGHGKAAQNAIQVALGIALLIAATGLTVRAYLRLVERARSRDGSAKALPPGPPIITVRPLPTVAVGAVGGFVVGLTSVGSGSLIIIALMALYPRLKASSLVGTDLVQAVPLVASAALAHILFGDFRLALTLSLILGAIPGVWLGAQMSARAPGGVVRRALAFVLLASAVAGIAPLIWMQVRRRHGFPATVALSRRRRRRQRAQELNAAAARDS